MWGHKLSWVGKAVKWEWISNPSSLEGAVIFRQKLWGIDKQPALESSITLLWCQARFVSQGQKGTSDSNADEREHFSPGNITRHEDVMIVLSCAYKQAMDFTEREVYGWRERRASAFTISIHTPDPSPVEAQVKNNLLKQPGVKVISSWRYLFSGKIFPPLELQNNTRSAIMCKNNF